MIAQSLQNLVNEVSGLWSWMLGMIAGWGLSFTIVVVALIIAYIRIRRLNTKIKYIENRTTSELRDLSLRIGQLEK